MKTNFKHAGNFLCCKKETFSFLFLFGGGGGAKIPEVTLANRQLMTHDHKTSVHKRTIHVHDGVNTSKAWAEILNQCLKTFRLFMHNLTPTTALDLHCIFGEDKRAGG